MISKILFTFYTFLIASIAYAENRSLANLNVSIDGGMSAGYFVSTNTQQGIADNVLVTDFLIELHTALDKTNPVGLTMAMGDLEMMTVGDGGGGSNRNDTPPTEVSFQYGYLQYSPIPNGLVEVGVLVTKLGRESAISYVNNNVALGALWNAQPAFYPGLRVNYNIRDVQVYVEGNNDTTLGGTRAFAVGASGVYAEFDWRVNYFDAIDGVTRNVVDIVIETSIGALDIGINFDWYWLDTKPIGNDDGGGYGFGVYIAPKLGPFVFPVRFEAINDGDSGVYKINDMGFDKGMTLTVTPTLPLGKNAALRAEISYVTADNKMFVKNGQDEEAQLSGALQLMYRF